MVPNVTRQLDNLPLTPNGKIDRNLLKRLYLEK
jgi:acyl-coenzyme A synthetase/AMP-(fatty) acid ligase